MNKGQILNKAEQPKALFIFAHGAGAGMQSDFMAQMSELLVKQNISVLRFNFDYMQLATALGKRRPPEPMPKLRARFEAVIAEQAKDLPLFIGGKSMGGRVAATLAADIGADIAAQVKGIVCLGYPFHPTKKPEKLRLEPLQLTQLPIVIVQGERDSLGSREEIAGYEFSALCRCYFVEDGDHSFKPRVRSGFTQQQHINTAAQQIVSFIDENS